MVVQRFHEGGAAGLQARAEGEVRFCVGEPPGDGAVRGGTVGARREREGGQEAVEEVGCVAVEGVLVVLAPPVAIRGEDGRQADVRAVQSGGHRGRGQGVEPERAEEHFSAEPVGPAGVDEVGPGVDGAHRVPERLGGPGGEVLGKDAGVDGDAVDGFGHEGADEKAFAGGGAGELVEAGEVGQPRIRVAAGEGEAGPPGKEAAQGEELMGNAGFNPEEVHALLAGIEPLREVARRRGAGQRGAVAGDGGGFGGGGGVGMGVEEGGEGVDGVGVEGSGAGVGVDGPRDFVEGAAGFGYAGGGGGGQGVLVGGHGRGGAGEGLVGGEGAADTGEEGLQAGGVVGAQGGRAQRGMGRQRGGRRQDEYGGEEAGGASRVWGFHAEGGLGEEASGHVPREAGGPEEGGLRGPVRDDGQHGHRKECHSTDCGPPCGGAVAAAQGRREEDCQRPGAGHDGKHG